MPDLALEPAELAVFVVLLILSAAFSGAEVALFSLGSTEREDLGERADRRSRLVLKLLSRPRELLVTILLLNTLVNVAAAILAALMTERIAENLGLSRRTVFALEVLALALVLLIVSEITPKLLAYRRSVAFSRVMAGPLNVLAKVLYPIVFVLARWSEKVQQLRPGHEIEGAEQQAVDTLSSDDLKIMVEIGKDHGSIEETEHQWIRSLLEFGETPVKAIMVNRLDITALTDTATLPDALALIRESGHSRLPLYQDHLDNILGIVYAKDLLPYLGNPETAVNWPELARDQVMYVPLNKKLDDLLRDFQMKRTHLAIVVDEYGGTAGLVTLEDVLEEVVGDIRDEHDEEGAAQLERIGSNTWRVDAAIELDELNDKLDLGWDRQDYTTLGGLIFHLAGKIPSEGDVLEHDGREFTVIRVDNQRIVEVHIRTLRRKNR